MEKKEELQLSKLLDHARPGDVLKAVKVLCKSSFRIKGTGLVAKLFRTTCTLYAGRFPGYRRCNTEYHDLYHSLEVFSASARLADGCVLSGLPLSPADAEDLLVAALFHDAGYIQTEEDVGGTGAKYTKVHVDRSAAFVIDNAQALGLPLGRAARVARLILGTDLFRPWDELPFIDEAERRAAAILASADLLGQMGDRAYLEKLLFLYYEFSEAGIGGYKSTFDVLRKTAQFYGTVVKRLDGPLGDVSRRVSSHFKSRYGVDKDLYRESIERQMAYLDTIIADDSSNFRKKLKRLDFAAVEKAHSA
jgi:hypothetical protein